VRRLRIAVLSRTFAADGGGAERYAIAVAVRLARGHEVHAYAQRFGPEAAGIICHRIAGPIVHPRWFNQLWFACATWWLTRRGYDIVHAHENTWHGQVQTMHVRAVKVGLFLGRTGWRRATRMLQCATSVRLWTYLLLERLRLRAGPGRAVVAVSIPLRDELAGAYPRLRDRIEVIPPGVALPAAPVERAAARRALGLDAATAVVLLVANDFARKGLGIALQALASLPPGPHLFVVGHRARAAPFERQAAGLGIGARVHFVGALDDPSAYYAAADVLVHPTTEDTFAMVPLEAMAHGVPVIVSGPRWCGLAAELVDRRDAWLLQDPRDAAALAAALAAVLVDEPLQARLAAAGRAVAQRLSWDETAHRYQQLFERLAVRGANDGPG
jgi:glycosyltransferase involved in cell wall biosynthesis